MKIAILSPIYPYRGGIAQFSARLFQALQHQGHEVKAFSFSRLYPSFLFPGKTQFVNLEDNVLEIPGERVLDSINPFTYRTTARKILAYEPDLVIIAYWMSFFAPAYSYIAGRLKGKTKIITLVHNAIPHEPKWFDMPLARRFFNRSDGFMIMSETVGDDLLRIRPDARYCLKEHPLYDHFGKKLERETALERLKLSPDKKTLLFFGLIREYKGLDILLEAMNLLDDSYQLIIAGEAYGSFDPYKEQIQRSKANDRIHLYNRYIDDSEVALFFSAADALVLPYRSATQSGVIPVAYHFETPVVVTNVGSLKQTIEQAQTGIVCEPDMVSLTAAINDLFATGPEDFVRHIQEEKKALSWDGFAQTLTSCLSCTIEGR